MRERPLIPRCFASLRSWSYVLPPDPWCDRKPPRRPDEMSRIEVRLASMVSPCRARSLFTVRAAISSALSSPVPRSTDPSLMCSYWRSRMLLLFATVGVVILSVGLLQFVYFERPGQETGVKAHIVGVFKYDPQTHQTVGPDRSEFARSEVFAAV